MADCSELTNTFQRIGPSTVPCGTPFCASFHFGFDTLICNHLIPVGDETMKGGCKVAWHIELFQALL